ncbi:MAG: T9SS type A sorting domain-containing protein, partial [Bacteroidia bacterium]
LLFACKCVLAQDNEGGLPFSFEQELSDNLIATVSTPAFDFAPVIAMSQERVRQGTFELTDKLFDVDYDMYNSGTWTTLLNGDRLWRLKITSAGAKKMCLYYKDFYLPEGAKLYIYNADRSEEIGAFTSKNNDAATDNGGVFSTNHLTGDTHIVEYYEPKNVKGQGHINIFKIANQFKSMEAAETCQIDVACPDGASWTNQKQGIVRVYVVIGSLAGYCSGSLVNNTAADCKKYILTAMHCALDESTGVETTSYNLWKFYFNYEKPGCATGTAPTTHVLTGCMKRAGANDGGGQSGSDFLLVEMTSASYPSGVTPYYNGWTRATTVTTGGIGIHHPEGDCKKISTFNTTPTSTSWGGTVANTHWMLVWEAGHGSTEPGSSGSPLINSSGLIFGHLTGGGSCCVANGCPSGSTGTGPTQPDAYGKLSYDWTSDGTTSALQLKPWLDPTNSGVTTLTGTFACTPTGIDEHLLDNFVNIYPNPNNGSFNVSVELEKSNDIYLKIYNVVGEEIYSNKITNSIGGTYDIDLTNQTAGMYFVEIRTKDSKVVKKINLVK